MVLPPRPRKLTALWVALLAIAAGLAAAHLGLFSADLDDALGNAGQYLSRYLPPDFSLVHYYARLLGETMAMAVWGTAIAMVLAFLSTLFGARNFSPSPVAYSVTRGLLSIGRLLPSLILAVAFVAAFGPGPLAGVVAISVTTVGTLGKLLNDSLETVDPQVLDGVVAAGGFGFQRLRFGGWPCIRREAWGHALFAFDIALRDSTFIGAVGAGGIGMELSYSLRLFDYRRAAVIILMIVTLILVNEAVSSAIRKRLA
jgi:phosphonate transport system permease protein